MNLELEGASSPLSAVLSVAIFLGFLLVTTQVLVHLHAVNVVTAVVFDEARRAAADPAGCAGVGHRVRDRLGPWGAQADVVCRDDGRSIRVRAAGSSPARVVAAASSGFAIDRGVVISIVR